MDYYQQNKSQFKYGKVAIAIGFLVTIVPYLHKIGMIAMVVGFILLSFSDEQLKSKIKWITIPIAILATLYFARTS